MTTVRAIVNGVQEEFVKGATVADVVRILCESDRGVAVALDGEVLPRSLWSTVTVVEGQRLEIVAAVAGG
ncbi:MAG: sulfur carrier protein ThiS [Acidimicrobiales bacterium]